MGWVLLWAVRFTEYEVSESAQVNLIQTMAIQVKCVRVGGS